MHELDFQAVSCARVLCGTLVGAASAEAPRTLALHGGGASSRRGYRALQAALAAQGHAVAAFDFAGQGESDGAMSDSSLDDRAAQALAVVEQLGWRPPISLVASSMGGHIACSLIEALRPKALVLFCPAAYEEAAQHVPFGPAFQKTIRATTAFAASPAFGALARFEGRLLLVLGEHDTVIPRAVEAAYVTGAPRARSVEVMRLPGAGHQLRAWLGAHAEERERVFARVLATLQD